MNKDMLSITVQHLFENECFSSWESCYTVWAHIRTQLTEQKAARSHLGQNIYMLPNFPFRHLLSKSRDSKPIMSELVIFMDTHVAQSWSAFQKSAKNLYGLLATLRKRGCPDSEPRRWSGPWRLLGWTSRRRHLSQTFWTPFLFLFHHNHSSISAQWRDTKMDCADTWTICSILRV